VKNRAVHVNQVALKVQAGGGSFFKQIALHQYLLDIDV